MIEAQKTEAAREGAALSDNLSNYEPNTSKAFNSSQSIYDLELECRCFMKSKQIPFDGPLKIDGEIHRFSIDSKGSKKDEWYVAKYWLFREKLYFCCSFGSWSLGRKEIFQSWKERNESFSRGEQEEIGQYIKAMQVVAEEERQKRQDEASDEAKEIWCNALIECPELGNHAAYLMAKNVKGYIARFGKNLQGYDSLIIPLINVEEDLRSLQFISLSEEGKCFKSFLPGGEKKGCFSVLGNLKEANAIFICEGFSTAASVYEATGIPVVIAFDCGNLDPVIKILREKYPMHWITIAADDDVGNPNNPGRKAAENAAKKHGCSVFFPKFPEGYKLPSGEYASDFNDLHFHHGLEEVREQLQRKTHFNPINIADILSREIPPKNLILKPWLREKDLSMLYAERGLGKTWLALSIAYAIASGGKLLNFEACEPKRVLYVDGEMPAISIKERLFKISLSSIGKIQNPNFFRIINDGIEDNKIRDLGSWDGQADINELIDEFDVLILDNLSCLIKSGDENEAGSWVVVQEWLLCLRKLGKTVLIIHHAGKSGKQRGTSKKEDVLDTVMALRKPKDWSASNGARFEIHYEKNRGFEGDDAKSFEASLVTSLNGVSEWVYKNVEGGKKEEAFKLKEEGMNITEIAEELEVNKSTVSRWLKGKGS